ncbi:MAG TPA: butyrate kinase [Bacteroidales bacterium]|nr:butyrate kinase [Bacteroidales bacterium]
MDSPAILTIKPEYIQTKIALYQYGNLCFLKNIIHPYEILQSFPENTDQYVFRTEAILEELKKSDCDLNSIRIIMARGGLLKPIASGIYVVNEAMMHDLRNSPVGRHSVNLGGLIANEIAAKFPGAKAYIADPAVVDELDEIARYTGLPSIKRRSIFHALNHKYTARTFASSQQKKYEDLNLIVANLGDGISIGAHKKGRVVDVNQAFDGEGPFSLERAGSLPVGELIRMCYSGKYSEEQMIAKIRYEGGVYAYLGTSSYYELEKAQHHQNEAVLNIFEAMAYQISKYIGSMNMVFIEPVDAILITGMLANNKWFVDKITERVKKIAPVHLFPGEDVLDALAMNGMRILNNEAEIKTYI